MVISELVRDIRSKLSENAAFEAAEIVMHALGIDRTALIVRGREPVPEQAAETAYGYAKRRAGGEPLQYILGYTEFMSLKFEVNPSVLIPRSDTETLVEYALGKLGGGCAKIIDIGAGSGCIGISIAKYHQDTELVMADISADALEIARRNAAKNNVEAKFLHIDIMKELPAGKYDAVISNPPYIKSSVIGELQKEVRECEPVTALDGGEDGLDFYRRITAAAPRLLNDGGMLIFEIGYDQGKSVPKLMEKDFTDIEVIKDLCGNDRVAAGVIKKRV